MRAQVKATKTQSSAANSREVDSAEYLQRLSQLWLCRAFGLVTQKGDDIYGGTPIQNALRYLASAIELHSDEVDALIQSTELQDRFGGQSFQSMEDLIDAADLDEADVGKLYKKFYRKRPGLAARPIRRAATTIQRRLARMDCPVRRNLAMLGEAMEFGAEDVAVLTFVTTLHLVPDFPEAMRSFSNMTNVAAAKLLGQMLNLSPESIDRTLNAGGTLYASGLARFCHRMRDMEDKIEANPELASVIARHYGSSEQLLGEFLSPANPSGLSTDDFGHMAQDLDWLTRVVGQAIQSKTRGINILFYGPPGSGKTEMARLIAQRIGVQAYEVGFVDESGQGVRGARRLNTYRMEQRMLRRRSDCFLIFDEVEDVFPSAGAALFDQLISGEDDSSGSAGGSKGWMNDTLEGNPVPTIWITNRIRQIDRAYLRRFAYHLEFDIPPISARRRIAERCIGELPLNTEVMAAIAEQECLSPAQITMAVRTVSLAKEAGVDDVNALMKRVLQGTLSAAGVETDMKVRHSVGDCDVRFLNVTSSVPLDRILTVLRPDKPTTLLLHGAPGTGKTTLAEMIAKKVERPLQSYRVSDLQSKYVGETERNIARMFREASADQAVLLLDEADSLLRDRTRARSSWEVTQVNEILQQMERFGGVFICATNLMEDLDVAAMRRFTFKMTFAPLTVQQRFELFLRETGVDPSSVAHLGRGLEALDSLTVGDFATVRRQAALFEEKLEGAAMLARLEDECRQKAQQVSRKIGFV